MNDDLTSEDPLSPDKQEKFNVSSANLDMIYVSITDPVEKLY